MTPNWEENIEIKMTGQRSANNRTPDQGSFGQSSANHSDRNPQNSWSADGVNGSNGNRGNGGKSRKGIVAAIAVLAAAALLYLFWPCSHDWQEATCTTAKICSKCEETEGEALGHNWVPAKERVWTESKLLNYSQCMVCKEKKDQTTEKLEHLLSDDEETFLITPNQFLERLKMVIDKWGDELELDVTCSWSDEYGQKDGLVIALNDGHEDQAVVAFYKRRNYNQLLEEDKNMPSEFQAARIIVRRETTIDQYLTAFVMACEPACDDDLEAAYEIVVATLWSMDQGASLEYGPVVYCMEVTETDLVMDVVVKKLLK